jgi:hypothetical protein
MKRTNRKKKGAAWTPAPPWVPLPKALVVSRAWQSLNIHSRRLIDFLMKEWMQHYMENGFLIAPRKQLESFGIHSTLVTTAIKEAERVGLIDIKRGKGRAPNRYALTWLPLKGETEPTDRWRQCDEQAAQLRAARKQAKTRQ